MSYNDLQQQARDAALLSTPLSTPYAEDQCWYDNDALRDEFVAGFLAAAEPRETELIELRPKLADRNKRLAAAFEKHDVLCAEIDTLSVRVAELEGTLSAAQRFIRDSTWDYRRSGKIAYGAPLGGKDVPPHLADAVICAYMEPIPMPGAEG